jgi:hypothetical protein
MTYNLTKPNRTAIRVPDLVSSSRDFGVEQFFQADDFRADDPSPTESFNNLKMFNLNVILPEKVNFKPLKTVKKLPFSGL